MTGLLSLVGLPLLGDASAMGPDLEVARGTLLSKTAAACTIGDAAFTRFFLTEYPDTVGVQADGFCTPPLRASKPTAPRKESTMTVTRRDMEGDADSKQAHKDDHKLHIPTRPRETCIQTSKSGAQKSSGTRPTTPTLKAVCTAQAATSRRVRINTAWQTKPSRGAAITSTKLPVKTVQSV